ncbi:MAG: hypothetical protein CM15mP92_2340 [Halieaceae bacterium]|nr:MAG: hypothetical protein CM15mP92_2340 [Halieaceae bacterium]
MLGGLLGQGGPDFWARAGFSDSPHFMYSGYDKKGEGTAVLIWVLGGNPPGSPRGMAPRALTWPSFTNVPNGFPGSYFPLRIEAMKKDYRQRWCTITAEVTVCGWAISSWSRHDLDS